MPFIDYLNWLGYNITVPKYVSSLFSNLQDKQHKETFNFPNVKFKNGNNHQIFQKLNKHSELKILIVL